MTKRLCNETKNIKIITECNSWIQPLLAQFQDMSRKFNSISHLVDNKVKRSAWIGGIGTVMKQIFGTLDENDGLTYVEAINTLQNNEKHLAALMKENILVTTSVLKHYNNTLHKIVNNEANLNEAIDQLTIRVNEITEITDELQIIHNINAVFDLLTTSILTISFQLEDIIDGILFSSQNILHPAILTPKQLHQELVNNFRHLPNDLELPVTLDINSIHLILNISRLVCYYVSNRIIFVLQVPLVNTREYVLFHNIALPTPYDPTKPKTFSLIIPDNKYIAMTKDKTYYCAFDNLEICKTVSPGNFICDIEQVYSSDAKPTCESEMLSKVISEKPSQCKAKVIIGKIDTWKSLRNNKWIYIQSEPNKISIDCLNSKLFEANLLGTGVLNIPKNCIGYCKSTTLIPKYNLLNVTSPINHIPDFNLINDTCCNLDKLNKHINNISPVHLNNIDIDNFNFENKMKIEPILNDLDKIENQQSPHIVQYGTHYSVLIILILILLISFLGYITLKKLCKSGSNRRFQFKVKINKSSPQFDPEIDRQDPDIEMTSPIAPIRSKI